MIDIFAPVFTFAAPVMVSDGLEWLPALPGQNGQGVTVWAADLAWWLPMPGACRAWGDSVTTVYQGEDGPLTLLCRSGASVKAWTESVK